jgi:hypothetical protein
VAQGQQHIHCSVSNCNYWQQGNKCIANEIMVTSDQVGNAQPDSWDAPVASTAPATPVGGCMETCCKTFADKQKKQDWSVDSVTKLT